MDILGESKTLFSERSIARKGMNKRIECECISENSFSKVEKQKGVGAYFGKRFSVEGG